MGEQRDQGKQKPLRLAKESADLQSGVAKQEEASLGGIAPDTSTQAAAGVARAADSLAAAANLLASADRAELAAPKSDHSGSSVDKPIPGSNPSLGLENAKNLDQEVTNLANKVTSTAQASGSTAEQFIILRAAVENVIKILDETKSTAQVSSDVIEQFNQAAQALNSAQKGREGSTSKVDRQLNLTATAIEKLSDKLDGLLLGNVISSLDLLKETIKNGQDMPVTLLANLITRVDDLGDRSKLDPKQCEKLEKALSDLVGLQQSLAQDSAKMNQDTQQILSLLIKELGELLKDPNKRAHDPNHESNQHDNEPGKLRRDYKWLTPEQIQPIVEYLNQFTELGDIRNGPQCLNIGHLVNMLSATQKDPANPGVDWVDVNSNYRVAESDWAAHFAVGDRREDFQRFIDKKNSSREPDRQLSEEDFKRHHLNNTSVKFLHMIGQPIVTRDRFCVTYVTREGGITQFDVNASDFYRERTAASSSSIWAMVYAASTAIGTAAVWGGLSLALPVPLIAAASAGIFIAGGALSTRQVLKADYACRNAESKLPSLIHSKMLNIAGIGTAAPSILLPILAHMHFVQQLPKEALAKQYQRVNPISNSPFSDLREHIGLMTALVRNWNTFETNCTDISSRKLDPSATTIFREKNIDEQYLTRIRKTADEHIEPLLRWQKALSQRAVSFVAVLTLGASEIWREIAFKWDRIRNPGIGRD